MSAPMRAMCIAAASKTDCSSTLHTTCAAAVCSEATRAGVEVQEVNGPARGAPGPRLLFLQSPPLPSLQSAWPRRCEVCATNVDQHPRSPPPAAWWLCMHARQRGEASCTALRHSPAAAHGPHAPVSHCLCMQRPARSQCEHAHMVSATVHRGKTSAHGCTMHAHVALGARLEVRLHVMLQPHVR